MAACTGCNSEEHLAALVFGLQGASPCSGGTMTTTPSTQHGSPKPAVLASTGQRVPGFMSGLHSSASEALAPVVEDPMDTAGAMSVEAVRDGPSGAEVQQEPPADGDDWQDGEHSASIQLEDEVVGTASSSLEDSRSVPLAAQHGRHSSSATGAGSARSPGQWQIPLRSKAASADSRGLGAGVRLCSPVMHHMAPLYGCLVQSYSV